MKLACLRTGQLLERRMRGLSAHEGLQLEEHLGRCASCRADANLLRELSELSARIDGKLTESKRERAIAAAFVTAGRAQAQASASRRPGLVMLGAAAVALAAAAVLVWPKLTWRTNAPWVAEERAVRADHVLSGSIELPGGTRSVGESLVEHVTLHTGSGAKLALAHAQVELRPDSDVSWDAAARQLRLQRGSVLVDVDPALQRSFSVETQHFHVQVLGTQFVVTERGVYVRRGRVSVEPRNAEHAGPAILLAAGSGRTQFELADGVATESNEERASAEAPGNSEMNGQRVSAGAGSAIAADRPSAADRAAALLAQARLQLASRDLSQARRTLRLVAPQLSKATLRAEALSLEAEASLLEGHYRAARDAYLRVAKRFPRLPAAETALFAAARIEADHGDAARARALLRQYQERYPSGSYRREVERRLESVRIGQKAQP